MKSDTVTPQSRIGWIYRWNLPHIDEKPVIEIVAFGKLWGEKERCYLATFNARGVKGCVELFSEDKPPWKLNCYEFVYRPISRPMEDDSPTLIPFVDPPLVGRRYESENFRAFVIRAIGSCLYTGNGNDYVFLTFESDGEIFHLPLACWKELSLDG